MKKHLKKAIQYVKENHEWSEACEQYAWEIIDKCRCPISQASDEITYEIQRLMDEYGEDHDLPEGWWQEYADEDEIFMEIQI